MASAQHYISCSLCDENVEFYCKYCDKNLCQDCALKHIEEEKADHRHQIVMYKVKHKCTDIEQVTTASDSEGLIEQTIDNEQKQIPAEVEEMCILHPRMVYGMCCKECKVPVCIKCVKEKHNGHIFVDTKEYYQQLEKEIEMCVTKMRSLEIPQTQTKLAQSIQGRTESLETIRKARCGLVSDAEQAKKLIDKNLEDGLKVVDDIKQMLETEGMYQETDIRNYVSDLKSTVRQYDELKSSKKFAKLINCFSNQQKYKDRSAKPIVSSIEYVPNPLSLEETSNVFGCLNIQAGGVDELKRVKKSLQKKPLINIRFSPIVNPIMSFEVTGIAHTSHISYMRDGMALFSDNNSRLVFANQRGEVATETANVLSAGYGCHAVTQERDLLIIDLPKHQICKITKERKVVPIINLGLWTPTTLYSSSRNGDIIVGMFLKHEVKIVRYTDKGRLLLECPQEPDNNLYRNPCYITENINGDICVSDWNRERLIVSDKRGEHRFSYSGNGSRFYPRGLLTDDAGRIFVCDGWGDAIHILDTNGTLLALVKTKDFGVEGPLSICYGAKDCVWVGNRFNNMISVVKITID